MEDAEISAKVASVMYPEFTIKVCGGSVIVDGFTSESFDYRTDDALGRMAVWLAKKESGDLLDTHEGIHIYNSMLDWLSSDNPHLALADAIIEIGDSND